MAMNGIQTWHQGCFIDQQLYDHLPDCWKTARGQEEAHLVRPGPTENAICHCPNHEHAKWIAQRLNLASQLEQMAYDYATGKSDGVEIVAFVHGELNQ